MNINWLFIFLFTSFSANIFSHEQINQQISKINQQLLKHPNNQELLLNRASLYFAHSEFEAALKDSRKVVKENPVSKKAWILEGESLLKLHRNSDALVIANQVVKKWPSSSDTILFRARTKAKFAGKTKEAIEEYNQAIELLKTPDPGLLIERADVQLSVGSKGYLPALKQLTDTRAKYGFIYAAQKKALEIAQSAGQLDTAWVITKDINQHMNRHDKWLMTLGDILMLQGKADEAKKYYFQALKSIETLSGRQKSHPTTVQRKALLTQLIKRLSLSASSS
ncbi:MAG: hypothetical protein L3J59_15645 [Methylococcaceae bacterium]|nr:hypothetical protein [Methylococcaceae bacterium]